MKRRAAHRGGSGVHGFLTDGHLRLNFTSVASSATVSAIQIVGLPAATYNQVRTWQYDPATQRLQTVTMPETGTVTYGYDSKGRPSTKTDGNGIRKEYTYDDKIRVTELHYKKTSDNTEVPKSAVVYSYDTNPYDASFTQYGTGRLAAVQYGGAYGTVKEMYSYTQYGALICENLNST